MALNSGQVGPRTDVDFWRTEKPVSPAGIRSLVQPACRLVTIATTMTAPTNHIIEREILYVITFLI